MEDAHIWGQPCDVEIVIADEIADVRLRLTGRRVERWFAAQVPVDAETSRALTQGALQLAGVLRDDVLRHIDEEARSRHR
jgi:hypothetical protein